MKRLALAAVLLLGTVNAVAQAVQARGYVAFEQRDFDALTTRGFSQNYDIGVTRLLTRTISLRLQMRADSFRGTNTIVTGQQNLGTLQLQPSVRFGINADTLQMAITSDYFITRSTTDHVRSDSTIQRAVALLAWTPTPSLSMGVQGQRLATDNSAGAAAVKEQWAMGRASYDWRGLQVAAFERYSQTDDGLLNRTTNSHNASVDYSKSLLSDRLTVSTNGIVTFNNVSEQVVDASKAVAVPVAVARALYAIDDTPSDGRDHPLSPYPGLTDGLLDSSVGISLGPTSVSFQNIAIDLGRIAPIDEIRIHARDDAGNPLRNGGGPVTWDVWTSTDGTIWTPVAGGSSSFNRSVSRYEIRFDETVARWFKVVNFGVNVENTNLTEVQAYHHETIDARTPRTGLDRNLSGYAAIDFHPVRRLQILYSGMYSGYERDYENAAPSTSTTLQHNAAVEVEVMRSILVRAEAARMESDSGRSLVADDRTDSYAGSVQYRPTRRLRFLAEKTRQKLLLANVPVTTDGTRFRVDTVVIPALTVVAGVGREQQTEPGRDPATRSYADLSVNAKLTRTVRLSMHGTIQQVDATGGDFTQLLGATRDNRISGEVLWRPGDPLLFQARVGWVSGGAVSGFTYRLRAEWYPFPGGSLLLGGSYDQDIDPMADRKATRAIFNPRWTINRWAAFDLNFTSVTNSTANLAMRQRTLIATLVLTQ